MLKINKLPGWSLKIDEMSNNVYHFVCTNSKSYKSDLTDNDFERGLRKCLEGAFDIERKIGRNINKFFYDVLLMLIEPDRIKESNYHEEFLDSWFIVGSKTRIALEGRDHVIFIEVKEKKLFLVKWNTIKRYKDLSSIKLSDLEDISNQLI